MLEITTAGNAGSSFLAAEMAWLVDCIDIRTANPLQQPVQGWEGLFPGPPTCEAIECEYAKFIQTHSHTCAERLVLALSHSPHLQPDLLDLLRLEDNPAALLVSPRTRLAMPTVAIALYLLAGDSPTLRIEARRIFRG